ncbi:MAG: hypothetical protein WC340_06700 [Kiritimatiellia bacterium]
MIKSGLSKRPDIVLWSRARLFRNVARQPFISSDQALENALTPLDERSIKQRKIICEMVSGTIAALYFEQRMQLTKLTELTDAKIFELYEQGVFSEYFKRARYDEYRGIVTGNAGVVRALVNERHHLVLQNIRPGFQLQRVCDEVAQLSELFGKALPFAWSKKFGYLMADSECCGTGLEVTINLHLPGLILMGEMSEVITAFNAVGLRLDAEISDDLFVDGFGQQMRVSNNPAVSDSEAGVRRKIEVAVSGLAKQEAQARLRALEHSKARKTFFNMIACSLAVLKSAVIMDRAQSYENLSWLRAGLSMGLVKGITLAQLDRVHRDVWSSNFLAYFRGPLDEALEYVSTARATVLRERLSGVKVTFM